MALDPSKGRDAGRGDYSAYVLLGIDRRGVVYVEADMARRPTPQMVADGVALCRRFRPNAFGVEANQYQELLCGELASEFRRQGLFHIVPAAIHNQVNKLMRIRRLGPWLSQQPLAISGGRRRRRGCWWISCAIFRSAHMMMGRMRWRWRCGWRRKFCMDGISMTDWEIGW